MKYLLSILFSWLTLSIYGQITLDECKKKARANYPLIRQYELIEKTKDFTLSNINKGNLPKIALTGRASYQSESTSFPFDMPGMNISNPIIPKDQYQAVVDIQQNIWDGGRIKAQRNETKAISSEKKELLNVNLYALNERINQLYFGILLLDEQLKQNELLQEQLERSEKDVTAFCRNGIANQADIDAVKVERIKVRQQHISLESNRNSFLQMLSLFIGESLNQSVSLSKPSVPSTATNRINRPELIWYQAQEKRISIQEKSLRSSYMPQFSLFAQAGFANPALDMFKDNFHGYYLVGARLNWNFGSLYTLKNNRRKLDTEREMIRSNTETFLFNTRMQLTEQDAAIQTVQKQMKEDDEMIRLQTNIRKSAEAKAANGTLSVTDMLQEISKESMARQQKAIHEIQLLMEIYQRKHVTNE